MSNRRKFLYVLGVGAFASTLSAFAQMAGKIFQIGYVGNSSPAEEAAYMEAFHQGLLERGYIEGKNIVVNYLWAGGSNEKVSEIIAEFVKRNVDVIVTSGTFAPLAAKRATSTIPIVMASVGDPVGTGIVASLSRPGGNITGMSSLEQGLQGKRLEILREFIPGHNRVAVLANPLQPYTQVTLRAVRAAAEVQGISVQVFNAGTLGELDSAFAAILKAKRDALIVLPDKPFFYSNVATIVRLSARLRIPAIYPFLEFVEKGGLAHYGTSVPSMFHRAGGYVDKILKGGKPSELPIEQATHFELSLNMKAAKTLGITIPKSILLRADRVIE
jgi:putative ABC transport system substrate-binding protein